MVRSMSRFGPSSAERVFARKRRDPIRDRGDWLPWCRPDARKRRVYPQRSVDRLCRRVNSCWLTLLLLGLEPDCTTLIEDSPESSTREGAAHISGIGSTMFKRPVWPCRWAIAARDGWMRDGEGRWQPGLSAVP